MINVGEGMLVFFPTQESRKATFDGELLQINRVWVRFSSLLTSLFETLGRLLIKKDVSFFVGESFTD